MTLSESVQPLSYGKYSYISQQEFDLNLLSLDFHDDRLVLVFPNGDKRPLTDKGFESLCRVIQVPLGFAKRLRNDHNTHVLTYLQKQLSQAYLREMATVVCNESVGQDESNHVLSVTTKDHLLPSLHSVCEMDAEILKTAKDYAKADLKVRMEVEGYLRYGFFTKKDKFAVDDSEYEFGHVFSYSLYGYEQPCIYQVAIRCADMAVLLLPFKPVALTTASTTFLGDLQSAIECLDTAGWKDLETYITRLKAVKASLREVKETRQKMLKGLKVDKDDKETGDRIEAFFEWKKLVERYEIKGLSPKPSKKWYSSAASHLSLFDVYVKLIAETTHAPSTLSFDVRTRLEKYASKLLGRLPDLAEKDPPKVVF